ncbi:MAG: PEP-CTERM sorting domain-containing protein [Cyanobacteria bacterium J06592_8]
MIKQNPHITFLNLIVIVSYSLVAGMYEPAHAATISLQPNNTFEVIDGGFEREFDGLGDEVFPGNFDTVVQGNIGENSQFAEFKLQNLLLPGNEKIVSARFQTQIFTFQVSGFGVPFGTNPGSLGIYGYQGNGQADASDFEAGILLNTVDISSAQAGDILTFDITNFIQQLVQNNSDFAGLGIQAENFGGLALTNFGEAIPQLTITTQPSKPVASVPEPTTTLPVLFIGGLFLALRKRLT